MKSGICIIDIIVNGNLSETSLGKIISKLKKKWGTGIVNFNIERVLPYQRLIFRNKAKFIRKLLNLLTIS